MKHRHRGLATTSAMVGLPGRVASRPDTEEVYLEFPRDGFRQLDADRVLSRRTRPGAALRPRARAAGGRSATRPVADPGGVRPGKRRAGHWQLTCSDRGNPC
jgi:hypothetical protein